MNKVKLEVVAKEHKEVIKGDKSGLPVVGLEHLIPKRIKLEHWDVNINNTFTKMFRKGDVLFGRRRAYLKKAAYATVDGICSGDITVIEVIPGKIYPGLLPFIIQNDDLFDYAVGKSAGSLSPRVKWEHLKNYEFMLPDDIEKQKQIADLLWSMIETRDAYVNMQKAADELVKLRFIELFGREKASVPFSRVVEDITKEGLKFDSSFYLEKGKIPIVDQGEKLICGYIEETGIKPPVSEECIVFGDHTEIFKYINFPFYLGADGTKILRVKKGWDTRFVFELLKQNYYKIGGYSRHYKYLKKMTFSKPADESQISFRLFCEEIDKSIINLQRSIDELDATLKKILEENFKVKEG